MEGRLATAETKLSGIASGANKTTVDSSLSSTSTNPVQNKVINTALNNKANNSALNSYLPLTGGTISGDLIANGKTSLLGEVKIRSYELVPDENAAFIDFHGTQEDSNDYDARIIYNKNNGYLNLACAGGIQPTTKNDGTYTLSSYCMTEKLHPIQGQWSWKKYSDGTAICWGGQNATYANPNVLLARWALPFIFAHTEASFVSIGPQDNAANMLEVNAKISSSTSNITVAIHSGANTFNSSTQIYFTAIVFGFWKT